MKKIGLAIAGLCVVAAVGWGTRYVQGVDPQPPTAEFIAEALKDQEARCGKSLEVKYEYWQTGHEDQKWQVRYIRSLDIVFVESSNTSQVVTDSFDRTRSEFRHLLVTSGGAKSGIVSNVPSETLSTQLPMDTGRRPLDTVTLLDVVRRGTVAASAEPIDGHDCWRVEVPAIATADVAQYLIWVDPEIGFCPRRVEIRWKDQARQPKTTDFKAYKDVGNGVWFPMEISARLTTTDDGRLPPQLIGNLEFVSKADQVNIDKAFTKEELTVQFPSGTEVRDEVIGATYTVP